MMKKRKISKPAKPTQVKREILPGTESTKTSAFLGVSRSISACQRCRIKKIKCDHHFPKCLKCEKIGVECIGLDPATGREVPRSYVIYLEDRVQILEKRLQENGIETETTPVLLNVDKTEESMPIKVPIIRPTLNGMGTDITCDISFSKLMTTAFRINKRSINSHTSSENPTTFLPAILPPKTTALQFIQVYFAQSNSQIPILHREEFIKKYFIPIYGLFDYENLSLASNYTPINTNFFKAENDNLECWFDEYKQILQEKLGDKRVDSNTEIKRISNSIVPPEKYQTCLYFLNLIFAIASSVNHLQYPITISESFRMAGVKYFDVVNNLPDHLESLQAILLYAVYATMRPSKPAVWYILGTALRMCVDIELHNETNTTVTKNLDAFSKDKRRRLFWCTYSIDRQICFYLDRPVGIPDESINTPLFLKLDDSLISPGEIPPPLNDASPSYKTISLSIIKIRQIQSEIQRILYTNCEVPRKYQTLNEWKLQILNKLDQWREEYPKSVTEMNCNFNLSFLGLNYHHSLLMIHNLSLKNYKLSTHDFLQVSSASKEVINAYHQLFITKSINYTWAAVHNLFLAGTSYLYTIYNSEDVHQQNSVYEIKQVTSMCLSVLTSLIDRCDAATNCCEIFLNLTMIIIQIRYNETVQGYSNLRLPTVNEVKIISNLSNLVENLNKDKEKEEKEFMSSYPIQDNLNPFINEIGPSDLIQQSEISQRNFDMKPPVYQNPGKIRNVPGMNTTFEWKAPVENGNQLSLEAYNSQYDLDSFLKELEVEDMSPESVSSKNDVEKGNFGEAVSPSSSALLFNSVNSQEGRKTFELMHQMPNEIIWDQFFGSNSGSYAEQGENSEHEN